MNDFLAWYFSQLAAHPLAGLAVQAGLIYGICYGLAALLERHENRAERRRQLRDLERFANHPGVRAHYLNPDWKENRP